MAFGKGAKKRPRCARGPRRAALSLPTPGRPGGCTALPRRAGERGSPPVHRPQPSAAPPSPPQPRPPLRTTRPPAAPLPRLLPAARQPPAPGDSTSLPPPPCGPALDHAPAPPLPCKPFGVPGRAGLRCPRPPSPSSLAFRWAPGT